MKDILGVIAGHFQLGALASIQLRVKLYKAAVQLGSISNKQTFEFSNIVPPVLWLLP